MDFYRRYRLPRPSFWSGFAQAFSFGAEQVSYRPLSDKEALKADMEAVAEDFYRVLARPKDED